MIAQGKRDFEGKNDHLVNYGLQGKGAHVLYKLLPSLPFFFHVGLFGFITLVLFFVGKRDKFQLYTSSPQLHNVYEEQNYYLISLTGIALISF